MNRRLYVAILAALAAIALSTFPASADEATAHSPQYDNQELWPYDVEKTDYFKETWPAAPVMIWAKTEDGSTPGYARIRADLRDPSNWLVDGQPATRIPDKQTDVVFPAGDYSVKFSEGGKLEVRHLTIQPGARISASKADIYGNLWVKQGGRFSRAHGKYSGWEKSNFCRDDNDKPHFIANFFTHNKKPGTSTEWIGTWQVGDEVNMLSGRFIVAPHSTFMPTDRRCQRVQGDAELVLMSGSTYHLRGNFRKGIDIQIDGKLRAGTPDRPLTEDCTLGLSHKTEQSKNDFDIGLVVTEEAALAVHSADPERARLVIRQHHMPETRGGFSPAAPPETAAKPQGITMLLMGELQLGGVEFHDVVQGGIMMPDPAKRTAWQHVSFAPSNFGAPDELFSPWQGEGPRVVTRSGRSAD